jgi:hypothetical protein
VTHQLCVTRHESAGQLEPFADSFPHDVGLTSERQIAGVQTAKARRLREEFVYSLLDQVRSLARRRMTNVSTWSECDHPAWAVDRPVDLCRQSLGLPARWPHRAF